jgi:hypothetical protein
MKESLWLWVRGESRLAEAGPDDQFLLLGTENHDLNRRPPYYLITAFLNADPAYCLMAETASEVPILIC